MRIGMLADIYKPHISGVTNHIDAHRRALKRRGHEVFVFTFGRAPSDSDGFVCRSPSLSLPATDSHLPLALRYSTEAQRLLATMDVLHAHHPFLSGRLALRYGRASGLPIVFTAHTRYDLYARSYLPPPLDTFAKWLLRGYLPAFCRAVDRVIVPARGARRALRELGVDADLRLIPNGVERRRFAAAAAAELRPQLGLTPDQRVLIYTGRLGPEKNLPLLLRAFALARQELPTAALVLVGRGGEGEALMELAHQLGVAEGVRFVGLLPPERIPGYLRMADAFATASRTESHPLSVIEALAAGLPIIAVDAPGVRDVVQPGINGLLASPAEEDLAQQFVRVLDDEELRRALAGGAAEAATAFEIGRTIRLLEAEYRELTTGRSAAAQSRRTAPQPVGKGSGG